MTLYVVIPTIGRTELCERAVRSVEAHIPGAPIIVVEGMRPASHARNVGVSHVPAGDDMVLMIDDDIWYDERVNIDATLRLWDDRMGVVQVMELDPQYDSTPFDPPLLWSPLIWTGGGMLFRKSTWEAVGGFREELLDDVLFSLLCYREGFCNYRSSVSRAHHHHVDYGGIIGNEKPPTNLAAHGAIGRPVTWFGVETLHCETVTTEVHMAHMDNAARMFSEQLPYWTDLGGNQ